MQFEKLTAQLTRLGIPYSTNEPMSCHTTFRVGGPVAVFAEPENSRQLAEIMALVQEYNLPRFLLGRGSNLLVGDGPIDMVCIHLGERFAAVERTSEGLTALAGASLATVCRQARDWGLTGLEFAYGIPGSVGGGVYMNAGAYGGEMKDVVTAVTCLDSSGREQTLTAEELEFGYRHSVFGGRPDWWILSAAFRLEPGDPAKIGADMEEIMGRRKEKQPLEYPSAGSTFKRPEGAYAAALIDQCGLKGYTVGGAQVSEKHAGFVINRGGATCKDIMAVISHVRRVVEQETGFLLEQEVRAVNSEQLTVNSDGIACGDD